MTRKEYKECIEAEVFKGGPPKNILYRLYKIMLQPNTNCVYLCRKMWYLNEKGGLFRMVAKLYQNKIAKKYGCHILSSLKVGKGFFIEHPIGIVMGKCVIGENFTILQNSTIGVKNQYDDSKGIIPVIGNNVRLCSNSLILGNAKICDNVIIGAGTIVTKNIAEPGVYVGAPARRINNINY